MSGSHLVTVEMVVNDDAARAKLESFLGAVGSNARLVAKDIDPWATAAGRFADKLQNMVMAGGSLYLVHRMVMATAEAAQRTADALSGNSADAQELSRQRASAYAAGWEQNLPFPELAHDPAAQMAARRAAQLAERERIDAAAKAIGNERGMFRGDAYAVVGAALQSGIGLPQQKVIGGSDSVASVAALLGQTMNIPPTARPSIATGLNMMMRTWDALHPNDPMNALGAAAFMRSFQQAGLIESPDFVAKYAAPAVSQLSSLTGQQEQSAEMMALLSLIGSDPVGATTGTASLNDTAGILRLGRGPMGRTHRLTNDDGSDRDIWDIVAELKTEFRDFSRQRGGGKLGTLPGTTALMEWVDSQGRFKGKAKAKAALVAWLGTEVWDKTEADVREQFTADPQGTLIDRSIELDRRNGNAALEYEKVTNRLRDYGAENAESAEGQVANALDAIIAALPGATDKERAWVKAGFFKGRKAGRESYSLGAGILTSVAERLTGTVGFDVGTDLLQGNAGAFAIMSDEQRSKAARVMMEQVTHWQETARTSGKPFENEQNLAIQKTAGQAQQGVVTESATNSASSRVKNQLARAMFPLLHAGDVAGAFIAADQRGKADQERREAARFADVTGANRGDADLQMALREHAREMRDMTRAYRQAAKNVSGSDSRSIEHGK